MRSFALAPLLVAAVVGCRRPPGAQARKAEIVAEAPSAAPVPAPPSASAPLPPAPLPTAFVTPRQRTLFGVGSTVAVRTSGDTFRLRTVGEPAWTLAGFAALADGGLCGVRASGAPACWGEWSPLAELSDVRFTKGAATDVPIDGKAVDVQVGGGFACLVHEEGQVLCWGSNDVGQLGRATSQTTYYMKTQALVGGAPGPVVGIAGATRIALGDAQGCALDRSGAVSCWGGRRDGPGGTLNPIEAGEAPRPPWRVRLPAPAVDVVAGSAFFCALLRDRGVRCWGANERGQLGVLPTEQDTLKTETRCETVGGQRQCTPTYASKAEIDRMERRRAEPRDPGVRDALQLAAGENSACALVAGGRVLCWGDDRYGQTGAGPAPAQEGPGEALSPSRNAPHEVVGLVDAVEVAVARTLACARRSAGALVCWGTNSEGAFGPALPRGALPRPTEAPTP